MRTELEIYKAMDDFYTKAIVQRDRGDHNVDACLRAHILAAKLTAEEAAALGWLKDDPR